MKFSKMTLSMTTRYRLTLNIMTFLRMALNVNDAQDNDTTDDNKMLRVGYTV